MQTFWYVYFANRKYEELTYPTETQKVCDPILVPVLKMWPHYSQTSRENATLSSGKSPLASYKEVLSPPPGGHLPRTTDPFSSLLFPVRSWNISDIYSHYVPPWRVEDRVWYPVWLPQISFIETQLRITLKDLPKTLIMASKAILSCLTLLKLLILSHTNASYWIQAKALRRTGHNQQVDSSLEGLKIRLCQVSTGTLGNFFLFSSGSLR